MLDREFKVIIIFLSIFVVYFYGALSVSLNWFPSRFFEAPISAASVLSELYHIDRYADDIRWVSEAPEKRGMVFQQEGQFFQGLTLFTSTKDTVARLMGNDGKIVHEWDFSFSEDWPESEREHVRRLSLFELSDKYFYLRDAHVFPNGDLLALISIGGTTPWGVGLVKLDKDSNVIWAYSGYVNNDFHVMPDGRIYLIEHKIRSDLPEDNVDVVIPFLEDNIVHLDIDGQEVGRVSLIDAINQSQYRALLWQYERDGKGDPTHSNSIEYVDHDHPRISWIKKGSLLVSVRNLNALVVFDPKSWDILHAMGLPTRMQHDIDYLENGDFMLFDNRGDFEGNGYTRVIEVVPDTQEIVWSYSGGDGADELHSEFFGEQQVLPNNHVMITHAHKGELREIMRNGEIVWRYIFPYIKEVDGQKKLPVITHAERIDPSYIQFDF